MAFISSHTSDNSARTG
uniref:Uncharacterized protein n=1 Tax=Rhizophora mucronata TaxID=61149 RepID=A0A2P2IT72_RHIMU